MTYEAFLLGYSIYLLRNSFIRDFEKRHSNPIYRLFYWGGNKCFGKTEGYKLARSENTDLDGIKNTEVRIELTRNENLGNSYPKYIDSISYLIIFVCVRQICGRNWNTTWDYYKDLTLKVIDQFYHLIFFKRQHFHSFLFIN